MVQWSSRRRVAVVAALCAALLGGVPSLGAVHAAPSPNAGPKSMVALGDSYASGPLIPVQYDQPWGCLRSANNYAHQAARALGVTLTDATCSGATTNDMWNRQGVSPEEQFAQYGRQFGYTGPDGNPPQLDSLTPDTDVVTLQIGGNDIGFLSLAETCAQGAVQGTGASTPCKDAVEAEHPFERIDATASKIQGVLEAIHARSPEAAVYVLGYPGIFAIGPTARCTAFGVNEADAEYMRSIQEALNGMIERVADDPAQPYSDSTRYVDVYGPSAGHTACDLPAIRWVEPIVPVNAAAPVHPNLGGMSAIALILKDAVWPKGLPRPSSTLPGLPAPPSAPVPPL